MIQGPRWELPTDWNRLLSTIVVLAWLVLATWAGGLLGLIENVAALALPAACIWFPEQLGELTTRVPGLLSMNPITQSSPEGLVRVFGWVALLALTFGRVLVIWAFWP